jgi:hypothetical protein
MAVPYICILNDHKTHQRFSFQGPSKFTKIGMSGLRIHIPSGNPKGLFTLTMKPRDTVRINPYYDITTPCGNILLCV